MANKISRRSFIKSSTAIGMGTIVAGGLATDLGANPAKSPAGKIDLSVVTGADYFKSTVKALEPLGGMGRFVKKGQKVAVLANAQRNNPGAYTNPEVLRAVLKMCWEAGAKEVDCISWQPMDRCWEPTGLAEAVKKEKSKLVITDLKDESKFKPVPVPNGKRLKEARVMASLYNYDVLISVPVTKDHAGNKFTATLKNMMGLNSPKNNRSFHKPGWKTNPDSIYHLDQCIADLNTVIKTDLCIVDATEFIITNGPFGPGKLHKPGQVVAGVDRVAIDSYCCTLWGLEPKDIIHIKEAHALKLGNMDLKSLKIKQVKI